LYNIIDTDLVKLIDDHKQFIALMRKVCNFGLVEYENIFKSIPYILGALVIQAREKHNCYFLTDSNKPEDKKDEATIFQGAFVYPTEVGYYKSGIISMDFNSLYPSVIRTLNLSPETKVGKVISEIGESTEQITIKKTSGKLVTITRDQFNRLLDEKCTMAANGVLFIKPGLKFGIVPSFLTDLYSARVSIKKEMKVHKQRAKDLDDEIKKLEKELKEMK
jgi:DNA polymerase elongation subunit (family B)